MKFFLPALALALFATPAKAQQCDVNLLTGLDISASVGASGIEMQVTGMAEALSSPPVVQAMTSGPRGCVGFALFLWADGQFPTLVDWRVISSPASAEQVAKKIAGSVSFAVQEATRAARHADQRIDGPRTCAADVCDISGCRTEVHLQHRG